MGSYEETIKSFKLELYELAKRGDITRFEKQYKALENYILAVRGK